MGDGLEAVEGVKGAGGFEALAAIVVEDGIFQELAIGVAGVGELVLATGEASDAPGGVVVPRPGLGGGIAKGQGGEAGTPQRVRGDAAGKAVQDTAADGFASGEGVFRGVAEGAGAGGVRDGEGLAEAGVSGGDGRGGVATRQIPTSWHRKHGNRVPSINEILVIDAQEPSAVRLLWNLLEI